MRSFRDRRDVNHALRNGHLSRDAGRFFERSVSRGDEERAVSDLNSELSKATFGRGSLAGRTGDPFKDDPFFNPWAKGGTFNKD